MATSQFPAFEKTGFDAKWAKLYDFILRDVHYSDDTAQDASHLGYSDEEILEFLPQINRLCPWGPPGEHEWVFESDAWIGPQSICFSSPDI